MLGGLAHLWGMRALVGNFRCPLHTDGRPALEKRGLMGSGWQMGPGFPVSFCYTFRRGFSCVADGALVRKSVGFGFDFSPLRTPCRVIDGGRQRPSTILPSLPFMALKFRSGTRRHLLPPATQTRHQGLHFPG